MEDPETFAGADIESAHVTLHVGLDGTWSPGCVRGANDHGVARDDGSRMQTDFTSDEIDLLIIVELEIDGAVHSETGNDIAGLPVQRDKAVTGCDIENPFLFSIGPIRQSATR